MKALEMNHHMISDSVRDAIRIIAFCICVSAACDNTRHDSRSQSSQEEDSGLIAESILRESCEYAKRAKGFKAHCTSYSTSPTDERLKSISKQEYSIVYERPNRISIELTKGLAGVTLLCDGSKLELIEIPSNKRSMLVAPRDTDALASMIPKQVHGRLRSSISLLFLLFHSSPFTAIAKEYQPVEYLGIEPRGKFECHVLRLRSVHEDLKLWIRAGDQPLIDGIEVHPSESKWTLFREFSSWSFNEAISDADFEVSDSSP